MALALSPHLETTMQTAETSDALQLAEQISAWLREQLERSGAVRFVLGLSGGIDSAVVAGLAARGVGPENVLGVMMPSASNPDDAEAARLVADAFGIPTLMVDLTESTASLLAAMPSPGAVQEATSEAEPTSGHAQQLAHANLKPRLRMTTLYYVSNLCRGIVLGTGNKTESMIGYFTKYGDGGVDLKPISQLYKREVREVARAIGVPQEVIDRPPSAGLWAGQTDEKEIGLTYDQLDRTLAAIEEGDTSEIDPATLERIQQMIRTSEHKRQPVPEMMRD
jgi:NAD+ synthase